MQKGQWLWSGWPIYCTLKSYTNTNTNANMQKYKYKYAEIADNGCGQVGQFVAPRLHPLIHSGLIIIAQCIYIAMMVGGRWGQPSMSIDYNPLSTFELD